MAEAVNNMTRGTKRGRVLLQIDGVFLAKCILSLPIGGFIACVVLSLVYDFQQATATHCKVANYLPSISAAIGGFTPQRYIWRICIGLHSGPRLMLAVGAYLQDYASFEVYRTSIVYRRLVQFNALLHVLENSFLVLLSMISSTENYHIHENSFILFMICSEIYMICMLILFNWSRSSRGHWTEADTKSYQLKWLFFGMNIFSFMCAIYFFFRHNKYCEPGVYTLFALCEYVVVITNILFHGSAIVDFEQGQVLLVNSRQAFDKRL